MVYQYAQSEAVRKARAVIAQAEEAQRRAQEQLAETLTREAELKSRQAAAERAAARAERRVAKKAKKAAELEAKLTAQIAITAAELSARLDGPTYLPTPEAREYWQRYRATHPDIETPEVGWRRLQAATREVTEYGARKRKAA